MEIKPEYTLEVFSSLIDERIPSDIPELKIQILRLPKDLRDSFYEGFVGSPSCNDRSSCQESRCDSFVKFVFRY